MSRERPLCQYVDESGEVCGLSKNAAVHVGYGEDKHEYVAPPREGFGSRGSPLRSFSNRPGRVESRRETREAMGAQTAAVPYCEGPNYELPGRCQGRVVAHHVIPRGMGSAKDAKVFASLCVVHHSYVENNRAEAKERGLLKKRPRPDLPPRRLKSRFED